MKKQNDYVTVTLNFGAKFRIQKLNEKGEFVTIAEIESTKRPTQKEVNEEYGTKGIKEQFYILNVSPKKEKYRIKREDVVKYGELVVDEAETKEVDSKDKEDKKDE